MIEDQNLTDKKNISYEKPLSVSKQRGFSDNGYLKKPKSVVVTTCNERGNFKNTKSVDENNQKSTITSKKLPEKTLKTQMTTNVNSSMERSVLLQKMFQNLKVFESDK